jgi:hypothetical protein
VDKQKTLQVVFALGSSPKRKRTRSPFPFARDGYMLDKLRCQLGICVLFRKRSRSRGKLLCSLPRLPT